MVKVERPGLGDIARWVGVSVNGLSALHRPATGASGASRSTSTPGGPDIVRGSPRTRRVRPELPARRRRPPRHRLRRTLRRSTRPRLRVAVGLRRRRALRGQGRVRHRHPGLRRRRHQPGRPGDRRAGLHPPDRRRQGHRAVRRRRRSPPRCSPASAGRAASTCELSMLDSVVSFLWADCGRQRGAARQATASMPSSFVQGFRPMRFLDGWGVGTPTSDADFSACAAPSASRAATTRASPDRRAPQATATSTAVDRPLPRAARRR